MSDMKLVVVGAAGRMGRTLVRIIAETQGAVLAGAIEREDSPHLGQDAGVLAGTGPNGVLISSDTLPVFARADGVLDFTSPAATVGFAAYAAQAHVVHVIGTTGCSADDEAKIQAAARHTPIVKSGNMSLGVNLLTALTRKVAQALDADYDIEIVEAHHRHKVDAPSGTALMLGQAAAAGRSVALDQAAVRARDGITGPRERGSIGFAVVRGGDIIGEHDVIFAADGERIVLRHIATDRSVFARGALKAALWAQGRGPGEYDMAAVLGL